MTNLDETIVAYEKNAKVDFDLANATTGNVKDAFTERAAQAQQIADWLKDYQRLKAMRVNRMSEEELKEFFWRMTFTRTAACVGCPMAIDNDYCGKNCGEQFMHYLLSPAEEKKEENACKNCGNA